MNRSRTGITMTAALLALGAWVAIAPAAPQNGAPSEQGQPSSQRQFDDASQMQDQTSAGQRQITGEITNLETATDPQTGQRHVVAQVRTSGGETIPVDLADPAKLRQADLQRGQQITVSGRYGQVNGQRRLIANRLQDEQGNVVQLQRVRIPEQQQMRQGQRQQQDWQYEEGTGGTQGFQQEGRPQQPSRQAQPQGRPSGQQMQQEWQTPHGWQEPPSGQMQQGWQRQPGGQEQSMDDQWQQPSGRVGDSDWQELDWNAQSDQQQRQAQQQRWQSQQEWQQQGQQPSWQTRQQGQARWLQEQGAGGSQGQQQQEGMGRQQRMAGLLVTGKMTDTREVQVQGQDQPFLLVKVVTRDGRTVIANLGPRNRLPQNLRLQRGEQVAVTGELGRINNQPVIIAHTFANVVDLEPAWVSLRQQGERGQQPVQRQQDPQAQQGQRQQDTSWQADELDDED